MPDLSNQLRSYFDATTTPVDVAALRRDGPAPVIGPAGSGDRPAQDVALGVDRQRPPSRARLGIAVVAACAVIALVAGLVITNDRSDEDPVPADQPEPTEPGVEDETAPVDPVDLPFAPNLVAPGRYSTFLLGIDVIIDVPLDMQVLTARAGDVTIVHGLEGEPLSFPPSSEDWTPDNVVQVSFQRIAGWSTRDEAVDAASDAASIDPDDVDAWIADNDLTLTSDGTIEVAGRTVRVVDVSVKADATTSAPGCAVQYQPCFFAQAIASAEDAARARTTWVSAAVSHRIFLVPIEGSEPLAVTVTAPTTNGWIDFVQTEIVESLEIGPDAPPIGTG